MGQPELDLCFSRARAFSSGGILKDKRENNRGNAFIQVMLSILYASRTSFQHMPGFCSDLRFLPPLPAPKLPVHQLYLRAVQNQSVHFFEG